MAPRHVGCFPALGSTAAVLLPMLLGWAAGEIAFGGAPFSFDAKLNATDKFAEAAKLLPQVCAYMLCSVCVYADAPVPGCAHMCVATHPGSGPLALGHSLSLQLRLRLCSRA